MSTPDAVLDRAADILQENGWQRGDYGETGGPRCVMGALREAYPYIDRSGVYVSAKKALQKAIRDAPFQGDIVIWNDAQRDKRKVIRYLRKAARIVRGEQ